MTVHRARIVEQRSAADFPPFFSLTPAAYEALKAELVMLRDASTSAYETLRLTWRAHQARWPDSSTRFRGAIRMAYQRGKSWTLTPDEYEAIVALPCELCGGSNGHGIGLDRLNHTEGYHVANVRSCCGRCNIDRGRSPVTDRSQS